MQLSSFVRRGFAAMVVGLAFGGATHAQQLHFELIAGGAVRDNGPALNANLAGAGDAAYDGAGNLYIAQSSANRIRKIAPNGTITTIVGGNTGFSGDNGLASQAQIDRPTGIGFDSAGNLYFNDSGNRRIRRITPAGFITTVAGNGSRTHSGDGGSALAAGFGSVNGLAVAGNGTLYVSDSTTHRIRRIANGIITTIAGTGTAGYSGDNGPATSAALWTPSGLDLDANGNLYFADTTNGAIRRIAANGTITTLLRGTQAIVFNVKVDAAGAVYTADNTFCRVVRFFNEALTTVAGTQVCGYSGDGGAASQAQIGFVDGIAIDPMGNVIFVDTEGARVRRVVTASGIIQSIAGVNGDWNDGATAIDAPMGSTQAVSVEADGDVLVTDVLPYKRVRRITPAGAFYTPAGNGLLYSTGNCATSVPCTAKNFGFYAPFGVVGHDGGSLLVTDRNHNRIFQVGADGVLSVFAGGGTVLGDNGPATSAAVDPYGIAKHSTGDVYFADVAAQRIRRINAGTVTTVAGTGTAGFTGDGGPATSAQINQPAAVAFDAANNLYFSELGNFRVRKVAPGGMITTIAGNGSDGTSGDFGPATSAAIGRVLGIAVHGTDVYLAADGKLRRIDAAGTIRTLPGWTHFATGLAVRNGQLFVSTQDGRVYRANLAAGAAAHDYDGDGRSDLAWRHQSTGVNAIWRGADNLSQLAVTDVTNPAWKIVGQGDFDGDGKSDLAWRNSQTGANAIWRSANNATQIAVVGVTNLAWAIEGVGDFNGDGKSDLAWRNSASGQNVLWYSGNAATQAVLATVPNPAWQIVGVGDFDGDGMSDLLWRNTATGANQVWRSGNSATQLPMTGVNNVAWKIQGVGDFDGDGKSDVFWRNAQSGTNTIWRSANNTTQIAVVGVTSQAWRVVAVGDYDGDGKDDLAWRNAGSGANTIWRSGDAGTQMTVTGVADPQWAIVPYEFQP